MDQLALSLWMRSIILFSLVYALVSCVTLDESGQSALILMSREQETQMGFASFNQLKQSGKISRDPAANAQVNRVAQRLISQVNVPGAQWEVLVFDDPSPNAFALPGGKIGVHTGILPLTQSDDGLAAVLGHELAHVTLRHGGQRVSQQMVVALGTTAIDVGLAMNDVKDRGTIMSGLGVGAAVGVTLPFSRNHELEADRYGLFYMARAGYNPEEAVAFWQRMKEFSDRSGGKPPEWLSTHPADENRIAQIRKLLPEAMKEQRKPL